MNFDLTGKTAVVTGGSRGLGREMCLVFAEHGADIVVPRRMEDVLVRARKLKPRAMVLSPHWFLDQDVSEYVATIKRELGWEYPGLSYPAESTNCYLNFIAVHNSLTYYGYTHYHVEMSKLIRQGRMSRDEALRLLEPNYDLDLLNRIAEPLDHVFS